MSGLIRKLGEIIAAYIQQGSLRFAALGAVVGFALGWGVAYSLFELGDANSWIARGVELSIILGLLGAVAGSGVSEPRQPVSLDSCTVWNLNHALAPILLAALLGGFFTAATLSANSPVWFWLILTGSCAALAAIACSVTYAVHFGEMVVVYRLPRSSRYTLHNIKKWGFEVSRGKYTTIPPSQVAAFFVQFEDGRHFTCDVSPLTGDRIAAILSRRSAPPEMPAAPK